jgi:hypothetical protein
MTRRAAADVTHVANWKKVSSFGSGSVDLQADRIAGPGGGR